MLPGLPAGTRAVKWGAGAGFVAGDTDRVFLVKGSGTFDLLVYWVGPGEWHARHPVPAGARGRRPGVGTDLAESGGRLFCLKGKSNELCEYHPEGDSWSACAALPGRRPRRGAALAGDGSRWVYALKGGGCCQFWRYDVHADSWTRLEDVPKGERCRRIRRGSDLCWHEGKVYVLKGCCRQFWCYDPSAAKGNESGCAPRRPAREPDVRSGAANAGEFVVFDIMGRRVPATRGRSGIRLAGTVRSGVYFVVFPGGRRATKIVVVP
jgi:hypothetical protein